MNETNEKQIIQKLELEKKLTEEELNELKDRLYSSFMTLFEEGSRIGKKLNQEYGEMNENIKFNIQAKINELIEFFPTDCLWMKEPPKYYLERKNITEFDYSKMFVDEVDKKEIKNEFGEETPEWANEITPFK